MSLTREGSEWRWDLALVALPALAALGSPLQINTLVHAFILVGASLAFAIRPQILEQPLFWFALMVVYGVMICREPLHHRTGPTIPTKISENNNEVTW